MQYRLVLRFRQCLSHQQMLLSILSDLNKKTFYKSHNIKDVKHFTNQMTLKQYAFIESFDTACTHTHSRQNARARFYG